MGRWGALGFLLVTSGAWAQNAKDTCVDASERGQKLVDERKLLAARAAFRACAEESCPAPVRRDCQTQLDALKKSIPSFIVRAKEKDGSDITQGTVVLDGVAIGKTDGQIVETDPGAHAVRVDLPDGRKLEKQVVFAAGDPTRDVTFSDQPTAGATPAAPPAVRTQWSTIRSVGFITIWVGAAGITAGVISQLLAIVFNNNAVTLQEHAGPDVCPSLDSSTYQGSSPPPGDCANAIAEHEQAITTQDVALGLFVGGVVVLVAGAVLFAVGGNKPVTSALHVTPLLGPHVAGLGLSASF